MNAKQFAGLSLRDFENSAIRDEIYDALKEREHLQADLARRDRVIEEMIKAFTFLCDMDRCPVFIKCQFGDEFKTDNLKCEERVINYFTNRIDFLTKAAAEMKDGN